VNRVFCCGDVHGGENGDLEKLTSKRFSEGKTLTKNDYVIIAGDAGLIWDVNKSGKQEQHLLKWFEEKPWTTLFVDGNHCNFDRIDKLPTQEMFGGIVGKVNNSIFHLKRGEIYTINGIKIFTFGGGTSIDKARRTEFVSWWKQEAPNVAEYSNGLTNLKKHNNKVDLIITHDCSERIYNLFDIPKYYETTLLQNYFEQLEENVDFDHWYFGHYHFDIEFDYKHTVLYNKVKEVTKK